MNTNILTRWRFYFIYLLIYFPIGSGESGESAVLPFYCVVACSLAMMSARLGSACVTVVC